MDFGGEGFSYISSANANAVLLLEILDVVDLQQQQQQHPGQHRLTMQLLDNDNIVPIAWAFLKLHSPNGQANTGKRVRLQLFKPQSGPGVVASRRATAVASAARTNLPLNNVGVFFVLFLKRLIR